MTRLIDADKLCEEFKERQRAALRWKEKAILDGDEERQIRADATLAFLSEVKLTIDNAPTIEYSKNSLDYDYGFAEGLKRAREKYEGRPHGKWIKINPESRGYAEFFRCSNCLSNVQLSYWGKECEYDYCPNCGADMREADNDTN